MKIPGIVRKHSAAFFIGIVFAVLCFIGINAAMEPASKSEFCGGQCHEMKTAYRSWELSPHGANKYGVRVECIDCHLPPKDKFFRHTIAKAYDGGKDVFKHYFGGDYDVVKARTKVLEHIPNKRCMHCHNSLLNKSGTSAARKAHTEVLNPSDEHEFRCVECHEDVAHQRENKLFSP
jgi:cytochrome c nitrite reductase small subunit